MIRLENISFSYDRGQREILRSIDFSASDGSITAILGVNGVGKSTLLKCINRIIRADSGDILLDGENVNALSAKELAKKIAYVPQSIGKDDTLVYDMVLLGRKPYIKWDVTERDHEIVKSIMKRLNIGEYADRSIATLSGGEAQKVLLARALAQEPRVLLLDEPTSSLDPRNQHEVLELVRALTIEKELSTICVVHDLNLAVRYCDHYLYLKDGEVYSFGGKEVVTPEIIEDVYGIHVHIIEHMGVQAVIPYPLVPARDTKGEPSYGKQE